MGMRGTMCGLRADHVSVECSDWPPKYWRGSVGDVCMGPSWDYRGLE